MSRPTLPRYLERIFAKWRSDAECDRQIDRSPALINVWRSPAAGTDEYAKLVCETICRVREECLRDALTDPYAEGIRGGFHFDTGKVHPSDQNKIRSVVGPGVRIRVKRTKRDQPQPDQEV